jgi:hypothetical protein
MTGGILHAMSGITLSVRTCLVVAAVSPLSFVKQRKPLTKHNWTSRSNIIRNVYFGIAGYQHYYLNHYREDEEQVNAVQGRKNSMTGFNSYNKNANAHLIKYI